MPLQPIRLHGETHAAGGQDPIPGIGSAGIQFDTDNEGGWLDVNTNNVDANGFGMVLKDSSTGGIEVRTANYGGVFIQNFGSSAPDFRQYIDMEHLVNGFNIRADGPGIGNAFTVDTTQGIGVGNQSVADMLFKSAGNVTWEVGLSTAKVFQVLDLAGSNVERVSFSSDGADYRFTLKTTTGQWNIRDHSTNKLIHVVDTGAMNFGDVSGGVVAEITTNGHLTLGATGAATTVRWVGGTSGNHPTTGTWNTGDWVVDNTGKVWICTAGGTSGTWANAGTGASPLTTKGDIWVFSSVDARLPVGSNGQILTADSTQTTGLKWNTSTGIQFGSNSGTGLVITTTSTGIDLTSAAEINLKPVTNLLVQTDSGSTNKPALQMSGTSDIAFTTASTASFFIYDHLGNPILEVDDGGTYHIKTGASWVADL